jgi:hypothetical protein
VLSISKACIYSGFHIIVCYARSNDAATQAKLDVKHARKVTRAENAVDEDASNVSIGVVDVAKSTPSRSRAILGLQVPDIILSFTHDACI